jgi:hypothetical protein
MSGPDDRFLILNREEYGSGELAAASGWRLARVRGSRLFDNGIDGFTADDSGTMSQRADCTSFSCGADFVRVVDHEDFG